MLMIAATSSTKPPVAYNILVTLYSYDVVILVRFFVATALLYLRFRKKDWTSTTGFKPWGGPTAAIIYFTVFGFLLVAAFIPPSSGSPFSKSSGGVQWYLIPSIGLGFLALGYVYYLGFVYVKPRLRKADLDVQRQPVIIKEHGEWVQCLEVVEAIWVARSESRGAAANAQMQKRRDALWSRE